MMSQEDLINYIYAKQREIKTLSKNKLEWKNKTFNHRIEYYRIKDHVDSFLEGDYYNRFIIMPGLRGVGKTTIIFQLYEYLTNVKAIDNSNILYLDINDLRSHFKTDLLMVIESFLANVHQTTLVDLNKKIFLFIDEAHLDENWANYGKLIFDKTDNIFMIFTGSSALDLEVNADATRRIKKEIIFPCNFREYLLLKHDLSINSGDLIDLILKGDGESVNKAVKAEIEIRKTLNNLNNNPNIEFEKFLLSYGFPFALILNERDNYKKITDIISKIITTDIPSLKNFNNMTNVNISRIITYLALEKPGETSNIKLANILSISPKSVNDILNVLEKTQLVFSIKPYGTGGKILKKAWQYFFLSPSIKAAINFQIGRYDVNHKKCLASLAETLVISSIFKLNVISNKSLGLFYDPNKKGVDFLIKDLDNVIPIEVGVGKKTKSQLNIAMNNYDSDYGILVSNRTSSIALRDNIIYIPLLTYACI